MVHIFTLYNQFCTVELDVCTKNVVTAWWKFSFTMTASGQCIFVVQQDQQSVGSSLVKQSM